MSNDTRLWVVIPNWNGEEVVADCLNSLENQTVKPGIVVVDNGSIDSSVSIIKDYEDVNLIQKPHNTGFTGGVNTGIEFALKHSATHVVLLNNDAEADEHWIEELVKAVSAHPNAMITSLILLSDSKIDSCGELYSISGVASPSLRNQDISKAPKKPEPVFAGSGGATLYPASIFQYIGMFDDCFFAYYEDVDLGYRGLQAGFETIIWPKAIVNHKLSHTSSKLGNFTRYHSIKNVHLLFFKNTPALLLPLYMPLFLLYSFRLFISSLLRLKPHVWLRAMWRVLLLMPHVLRSRRKIKNSRVVSVKYIHRKLEKNIL